MKYFKEEGLTIIFCVLPILPVETSCNSIVTSPALLETKREIAVPFLKSKAELPIIFIADVPVEVIFIFLPISRSFTVFSKRSLATTLTSKFSPEVTLSGACNIK